MVRNMWIGFVVALIACCVTQVSAQYKEDRPSKVSVSLVNFVPMSSELRDIQSFWLGPRVDYHLKMDEDGRPTRILSATILAASKNRVRASIYPWTYSCITRKPISATKRNYFGYGAGFNREKLNVDFVFSDTTYRPSAHVFFGREFHDTIFLELRADFSPNWQSISWSGLSLILGTRRI